MVLRHRVLTGSPTPGSTRSPLSLSPGPDTAQAPSQGEVGAPLGSTERWVPRGFASWAWRAVSLGMAGPRRPITYPQNQLLGGQGHEDAVTPRRAPRVHVLLALAGVFAVRVAEGTGHRWSALPAPAPPLPPARRAVPRGWPGPPKERLHVQKFPEHKVKLTNPLKKRDHLANSGFSLGHNLKYSENHPQHPVAAVPGPSRPPCPQLPPVSGSWLQALHGPVGSACTQHREPLPGAVSEGAAWRPWQVKLPGDAGPWREPQGTSEGPHRMLSLWGPCTAFDSRFSP